MNRMDGGDGGAWQVIETVFYWAMSPYVRAQWIRGPDRRTLWERLP